MVPNSLKFRHTANWSAGRERSQGRSCWAYAAPHTIHTLIKRTERESMVTHPLRPNLLLAPVNPMTDKDVNRPALVEQLVELFKEPKAFSSTTDAGTGNGTGMTNIDLEEQAAGYQAAYSKLATAVVPQADVVAYAGNGDVRSYVAGEFRRLFDAQPDVVRTLLGQQQVDQSLIRQFLSSLGISV
jgi:hypothetical protein